MKRIIINNETDFKTQFSSTSCIYVITYDIDLQEGTLEIPENCTLEFIEGKICNGIIRLNKTYITAPLIHIFDNITFDNSYEIGLINDIVRVEWFKSSNDIDDTNAFQKCIELASINGNKITLLPKKYFISDTLNLYSATIIEGTIIGIIDRNRFQGTRIVLNIDPSITVPIAAMRFCTKQVNNIHSDYKTTCLKFRLSNLSIENSYPTGYSLENCCALEFDTTANETTPRSGIVQNLYIVNFHTAINIKALSYVEFNTIYITQCRNGILIDENISFIEFGWFNKIIINNGTLPIEENNVIGINVNSGNNLYFNEIDLNDCNIGFNIKTKKDLFSIFLNRINAIRCNTCINFHMEVGHITRIKISEVTMGYGECNRKSGKSAINNYYGLKFMRNNSYTINCCSFTDIYDLASYTDSDNIHYYSIYIDKISLDTCNFERMRILNPMHGVSRVHKLGILNFIPLGEITISSNSTTGYVRICSNDIFSDKIYPPLIIIPNNDSPYPNSHSISFDNSNKLTLCLTLPSSNDSDCKYKYIFPTMN